MRGPPPTNSSSTWIVASTGRGAWNRNPRGDVEAARVDQGALSNREAVMLWTIIVILLILWLAGFAFNVAGGLIHVLLVVALAVLLFNFITGRRAV
jgi:hypothetical protein